MAFKKIRNMKVYSMSGYRYRSTPTIQLKGEWLREIGFDIGDYMRKIALKSNGTFQKGCSQS